MTANAMPPANSTYDLPPDAPSSVVREDGIETGFIEKLVGLKYDYRPDITDRASLERNFGRKIEAKLQQLVSSQNLLTVHWKIV